MKKILVGAGSLDEARLAFSAIRDKEVVFVETPEEVIRLAFTDEFEFVYTELDYQEGDHAGFRVLEAIEYALCIKILWTNLDTHADLSSEEIRNRVLKWRVSIWDRRIPFSL
jgi:hypothetical protein